MAKENKKGLPETAEKEFVLRVRNALFEEDNSCYMKTVDRIMDETGETAAEIAAALIGMAVKSSAPHPKKAEPSKKKLAPEKPVTERIKTPSKTKPAVKAKPQISKHVCLSINGGLNKHFTHKDILGALSAKAGLRGNDISDVQIGEKQTLLKVSSHNASKIISVMNTAEGKIKGVPVKVQIHRERKNTARQSSKKNHLGKR